jgi:signal transduction histidine kinase/CheY-like chemotaxis protein
MPGAPPTSQGDREGARRLERCIRDLATLNALPSMCIGRSPDEALDIVLDALPTALSCDLIYLWVPGSAPVERGALYGARVPEAGLVAIAALTGSGPQRSGALAIPTVGDFWCFEAAVPVGAETGRLIAGRASPLDPETDRVLVSTAANLIGTALESARVLENARRKDNFLAMLGHELRNPLAPILTAVELLARHPSVAREQQVIERHTRHLARLVDDLLDISRVTSGHVELRSERVSLSSVLERAAEVAAPLVARHRHTLHVASAEGIFLEGDPVRLAQVFGNLLVNAAKFTPASGKIDVTIDRGAAGVRIAVRDNGRGISRDQLGRIFEPFVQADHERDALSGGLGLGLAIVKSLVERHHGTIAASSDGRDRGATFTIELPTVDGMDEPAAIAPAHAPSTRSAIRVLVVDDNVDVAELLAEALRFEGFQTAVEHNARAALDRWHSFVPHAAILDVGLPDLDGYALANALREQHGADPTLIAATGYGQQKDRARAAQAGFDCHFVKPVSVRDLVLVLDQRVVSAVLPGSPT